MVKPVGGASGKMVGCRIPESIVRNDLIRLNIQVNRKTRNRLFDLPAKQYTSLVTRLEAFKAVESFSSLIMDPPKKIKGFDFSILSDAFLVSRLQGITLDLSNLEFRYARFLRDSRGILAEAGRPQQLSGPPIFIEIVDPGNAIASKSALFFAGEGSEGQGLSAGAKRMVPYHAGSRGYPLGAFVVEYTGGRYGVPAKVFDDPEVWKAVRADGNEIVRDLYGDELPEAEAVEHFRHVDHSYTVRLLDGTPVARAMTEEITDYIDPRGKVGKHIYYTGILAKKGYQGGIFVNLTFDMMFQIFRNLGIFRLIFKRTPLTFRTQDERIVKFGVRYFNTKLYQPLSEEEQFQIDFIAGKKGWQMKDNVCPQVYNRMMTDKEKHLVAGLNPTDAQVFTGSITMWSVIKLAWDAFFGWAKKTRKA